MAEFGQFIGNGLVTGSTYALAALGLALIFGHMRVINFAHGELYMLGAFLAYTTTVLVGLPFLAGWALAVAGVMVLGAFLEQTVFRPIRKIDEIFMPLLATIALAVILPNAAILVWNPIPKRLSSPISGGSIDLALFRLAPQEVLILVGAAISIVVVHLFFTRSRLGTAMRAAFQDPTAAWLMGLSVDRMYVLAFAIGSGLAALAGILISTVLLITPFIGSFVALKAFIVVILGGMRSFAGAVLGGLILGVTESLAAGYISSGYKDAVGLVILMLILMVRPEGLFGGKRLVEA